MLALPCPTLAIFDLDGTLADSLPWFRGHMNDVADRFGFRRVAEADIEPLRRMGPREILEHLGVRSWKVPFIARHMRRLKAAHIDDIPLFPGAAAMLRALADGGVRLALVTSDSEANARRQLGDANAALFADFACGVSVFGKAAKFRRVMRRAGVEPAHRRHRRRGARHRGRARRRHGRGRRDLGLCRARDARGRLAPTCCSSAWRTSRRSCSRRRLMSAAPNARGASTVRESCR